VTSTSSPAPEPSADEVVLAYSRETVDDFLRAVEGERARIEDVIRDERAREARARSLLSVHESMVATMSEAYREVTRCRLDAEAAADAIRRAAAYDDRSIPVTR
jgi:hypothetical protein